MNIDDKLYFILAKFAAKKSTCLKRQYGAIIVKRHHVVSMGWNDSAKGLISCKKLGYCNRINVPHNTDYSLCNAVHAEQNAIIKANRKDLIGATLYLYCLENGVTISNTEPCNICEGLIRNTGIKEVKTIAPNGEVKTRLIQ